MKFHTHNVLTVSTLSVCTLALTGWTGALPVGSGTMALVSTGLIGLALFPSISLTDRETDGGANERTINNNTAR